MSARIEGPKIRNMLRNPEFIEGPRIRDMLRNPEFLRRTGRCGKTGVATTFINKQCSESILLDLKYLLKEAKQRIPPVLMQLEDPDEDKRAEMAKSGTALSSVMSIVDMNKRAVFRAQRGDGNDGGY
jgi:hypothetical protein